MSDQYFEQIRSWFSDCEIHKLSEGVMGSYATAEFVRNLIAEIPHDNVQEIVQSWLEHRDLNKDLWADGARFGAPVRPPIAPEIARVLYNCGYDPYNVIFSFSDEIKRIENAIGFELKVRAVKFVGYQTRTKKIHQYGVTGYDVLKQYALRLGHDPKLKRHLRVRDRAVYLMNWITNKLS